MDGSWWRVLIKRGPMEKVMANHFSVLALRTPWTAWKGKKIGHWKMNSPGWYVPNMLLETSGEIIPERMKRWSQSKNNTHLWMWLVMEVKLDAIKNYIAWEPGMLGPWIKANWKWSNGTARENIVILGISKLKWTGMGEFNSDDHYVYYDGQESLRRNGVAIMVNKRVQNAVQFSSVAQLSLTLCNPRNHSTPGLPVHHQLLDFTQTHVHWVSDAIQSSHPLSSPSPAFNLSQHQGVFQWASSSH